VDQYTQPDTLQLPVRARFSCPSLRRLLFNPLITHATAHAHAHATAHTNTHTTAHARTGKHVNVREFVHRSITQKMRIVELCSLEGDVGKNHALSVARIEELSSRLAQPAVQFVDADPTRYAAFPHCDVDGNSLPSAPKKRRSAAVGGGGGGTSFSDCIRWCQHGCRSTTLGATPF